MDADAFITTDVYGTHVLLEAATGTLERLHLVSTDEVYGDVHQGPRWRLTPGRAFSYAASKAAASCWPWPTGTLRHPITITRGGNNIGPTNIQRMWCRFSLPTPLTTSPCRSMAMVCSAARTSM